MYNKPILNSVFLAMVDFIMAYLKQQNSELHTSLQYMFVSRLMPQLSSREVFYTRMFCTCSSMMEECIVPMHIYWWLQS